MEKSSSESGKKQERKKFMTSKKTIKSAFESLMFVWGEPLDVKTAAELFNISNKEA